MVGREIEKNSSGQVTEESIDSKQAAGLLACSFRYLRDHSDVLGTTGTGQRGRRFSLAQTLQRAKAYTLTATAVNPVDLDSNGFDRSQYYSSREVAEQRDGSISNIPLKYYCLPGAGKYKGDWFFPKTEVDRQLARESDGDLLRRPGLARFLKISDVTLKRTESRGEIEISQKVGVRGDIEYTLEAVLKYVAFHYPDRYKDLVRALARQQDLIPCQVKTYLRMSLQTKLMLKGVTHFDIQEAAAELDRVDPYSISKKDRGKMGEVNHSGRLYFRKTLVWQMRAEKGRKKGKQSTPSEIIED